MRELVVLSLCLTLVLAQERGYSLQILHTIMKLIHNVVKKYNGTNNNDVGSVSISIHSYLQIIFPGTEWCGEGDIAKSKEELGMFNNTDDCCRHHDNCVDFMVPGESKHGLNNTGFFVKSHCDCDVAFKNCLKKVNSMVSFIIGVLYFDILRPQCYKLEYPIVGCEETELSGDRCKKYKLDRSRPKEWQWFDTNQF